MKAGTKSGRYLKIVEWSDADNCFVGSAPPLIGPCCHGDDEVQVYRELSQIVEEWIETLEKEGRPLPEATAGKEYSGKFVLRMDPDLHKALVLRATQADLSLNNYCINLLRQKSSVNVTNARAAQTVNKARPGTRRVIVDDMKRRASIAPKRSSKGQVGAVKRRRNKAA